MSGLQKIRKAVETCAHLGLLAQTVKAGPDVLEAFAEGKRDIPADAVDGIVDFIFAGHLAYDHENDRLVPKGSLTEAICLSTAYPTHPVAYGERYDAFDQPAATLSVESDGREGMRRLLKDGKSAVDWR
jgi:hypothetical protein